MRLVFWLSAGNPVKMPPMILDTYDLEDGLLLQADLCIIGAGAAGISMALEFTDSKLEVLLLEAGGLAEEPETQALYQGAVVDARLHSPPDRYRQRRFGGSTSIWGGRCMPFDAIDFDARDYMPHSGWPISLDSLTPYYPKANRLCEAGAFLYTAEDAFSGATPPIIAGFDSPHFTSNTLERFSCPTDFGRRYASKLQAAPNIRVLLHANVTSIDLAAQGERVQGLKVANLKGKRFRVSASQYVLASGGLETARVLLASRGVQRNGIGNRHDGVGRYYMCHLAGTIGSIKVHSPPSSVWHGYLLSDDGVYCRRRFALRPATQRTERLGNFVARLHHPRIADPEHHNAVLSLLFLAQRAIPYEYRTRLIDSEPTSVARIFKHVGNAAWGGADAVKFAWHMLRDRKLAERKFPSIIIKSKANLFSLDFHAEQTPIASSRVTLAEDRDPLDMPRLKVDWRYTREDVDTVCRSVALLADDLRLSKIADFSYDPQAVETEMTRYGAYGGHHIGTARMGTEPKTSVVNSDCRIHDVHNLFLAGSATFPTSSQANPTLTIVAMSLRLSSHLKLLLRPRPTVVERNEAMPA